ncbi:MAG TPA: AAA family ATPase [Haliangiales bacterium]|nr:AAA family ATPase [Haliangiales bacterium]
MIESPQISNLDDVRAVAARIRAHMRDNVMGRDNVIELVLVALFADGHVLLEDYPGSGKTTLAKSLGHSILDDLPDDEIPDFRRIQFTPDLLPSDVTGVMIFDTATNTFQFRRGPVFAYVVLVDEINRTSPKVQSALLEAMAEKQVTVDNVSHKLNELFFVMATQNPLDAVGTYPLPLAQLDRFLFKLVMRHIDRDSELEVLRTWGQPRAQRDLPRVTRGEVVAARRHLRGAVAVAPAVHECLVDIAQRLRDDKRTRQGVSTRCLVQAIPALQTLAMLRGRDFVSSEDVEYLAAPLFGHRLELAPGVKGADAVIGDAVRQPLEALSRATLGAR